LVGHAALLFRGLHVRLLVPIFGPVVPATAAGTATIAADLHHVFPVTTYDLSALATGFARFFSAELMGRPLLVGGPPTLSGDFTLAIRIHKGESATSIPCHD
jgi:hypothetical protein